MRAAASRRPGSGRGASSVRPDDQRAGAHELGCDLHVERAVAGDQHPPARHDLVGAQQRLRRACRQDPGQCPARQRHAALVGAGREQQPSRSQRPAHSGADGGDLVQGRRVPRPGLREDPAAGPLEPVDQRPPGAVLRVEQVVVGRAGAGRLLVELPAELGRSSTSTTSSPASAAAAAAAIPAAPAPTTSTSQASSSRTGGGVRAGRRARAAPAGCPPPSPRAPVSCRRARRGGRRSRRGTPGRRPCRRRRRAACRPPPRGRRTRRRRSAPRRPCPPRSTRACAPRS